MCKFKYDIKTASRILRDKVNEPYGMYRKPRRGGDRITLADAEAYCLDVRDNHERMEAWRKEHESEPYPNELFRWQRSHKRALYTTPDRGPAYCRMVEEEYHMGLNVPVMA